MTALKQQERDVKQFESEGYSLIIERELSVGRMAYLFINVSGKVIHVCNGKIAQLSLSASLRCFRENFLGRSGFANPKAMDFWLQRIERLIAH